MAGSLSQDLKAEPNLTPLLDVVFQLITFFMLVINFSQETYDIRIKLPVAPSARPVESSDTVSDRLVLNINQQGRLLFNGRELSAEEADREIRLQAELVKISFRSKPDFDPENLPTTVVIRADRGTPFAPVHRLITASQAHGFRKFALKAMTAER
jgi:biopolymer transport protein ExbD